MKFTVKFVFLLLRDSFERCKLDNISFTSLFSPSLFKEPIQSFEHFH